MDNNTKMGKSYGLITAIAMVVGTVIGSGVFFKGAKVLETTNGDMWLSIAAWLIVGAIMIVCSYVFSILATRHEKVNGIVDYSEKMVGKKYSYFVGWFMATIYSPSLTGVLCWVSAWYTGILFGIAESPMALPIIFIAVGYMIAIFIINVLSPKIAGIFQVSTTIIKLVPLLIMAIVGTIMGLVNGITVANFGAQIVHDVSTNPLMAAVVAVAFAYEGWIIATSINSEIKDGKKNLPLALIIGSIIIISIYILYFVGIASAMPAAELITNGDAAIVAAFEKIFSSVGGTILMVFIVISCLGTTNGLMISSTRGLYALGVRGMGPSPSTFAKINNKTKMPMAAALVGFCLVGIWLFVWFANFAGWWVVNFDMSELPIVTLYAIYIPIFIRMMIVHKELNWVNRFLMPALAIAGSIFMVIAAAIAHNWAALVYLGVFAIILGIGTIFIISSKNNWTQAPELTEETKS